MPLASLILLLQAADASTLPPPDPQLDVVMTAHPPHCRLRDGDPADTIDTTRKVGDPAAQVIRPDWKTGALGLFLDDYPVTGPTFWQRNGAHLDDFRFRVPDNGSPLCIGSKQGYPGGYGSLRRGFDAKPYHGRVLRFTAYVATWRAGTVIFWLAAGRGAYREGYRAPLGTNIVAGNNSDARPIKGTTHGWTPISYTIGPIPCSATQVSYGLILDGGGDVWMYKPQIEVIPDAELQRRFRSKNTDALCKDSVF
ncbi:MAG TPA: hypothetical protein VK533_15470 [Sphingomonas sp.]|uniref:hypothetical protein n=1 Tax=Sphingomonas sp. TaxID=28214 RepID=UPI002B91BED3|nr:hypothetical protein [Sphingomonas sp.]HMI20932.1 hypothetical protein [Sphingomonas sp.]